MVVGSMTTYAINAYHHSGTNAVSLNPAQTMCTQYNSM